jgi:hypothetical protein
VVLVAVSLVFEVLVKVALVAVNVSVECVIDCVVPVKDVGDVCVALLV